MDIYFIGETGLFEDQDVKYSTTEEAYLYLKEQSILSIDIETTRKYDGKYGDKEGLSPYLSKIVMFQIGTLERQYIIDTRFYSLGKIQEILRDNKILKIGHNLRFEYGHILHNYGIRLENLYDTMITEQILNCGLPDVKNGLKDLIERYFGVEVDKATRLEFLKIKDRPFSYKQLLYGAEDIIYPLKIRELQQSKLIQQDLQFTVDLESKFIPVLGDIEYKGMNFNKKKWEELYEKNLPIYHKHIEEVNEFVVNNFPQSKFISKQLDLFDTEKKCIVMWSSPKQSVEFFKSIKACPKEFSKQTGKLEYTVNAKVLISSLNTMNKDQPKHIKDFIQLYIKMKEIEQKCTTFGIEFFSHINPITKRVHSNFRQILNTGRISSTDPNLQNIPSDPEYRMCFDAPEDSDIVNCDYSGQETVVITNLSQEKNMMKLILENGDMHCFVTKAIHPELAHLSDNEVKKHHKDKRQVAKAAGFAINYGGNGFTIAKNLGITTEEGDRVYEAYFKAFPDLKNYFNYVQKKTLRQGYVLIDNITGRKSYYLEPQTGKERHAILKKALNYPVQGLSGSMTKYASILYRRWILEQGLQDKVFLTNLVHDEINVESKKDYSSIASKELERCMVEAADVWCKLVPMKASAVISNYWGH